MLDSYQDVGGNYNGDLALLLLKRPAELSATVSPVCIDWGQKYLDVHLKEGNAGIVSSGRPKRSSNIKSVRFLFSR